MNLQAMKFVVQFWQRKMQASKSQPLKFRSFSESEHKRMDVFDRIFYNSVITVFTSLDIVGDARAPVSLNLFYIVYWPVQPPRGVHKTSANLLILVCLGFVADDLNSQWCFISIAETENILLYLPPEWDQCSVLNEYIQL